MKKNYEDITFLKDRSGSMVTIARDVEGGFDTFINEQKEIALKEGYTTKVSLYQFDDIFELVYLGIDIKNVEKLKLVPRGNTALVDALGRSIKETGARFAAMPESERPEKVLFVVITDGVENASTEYKIEDVKKMIEEQQKKYNWQFVFLASNQDAILTGCKYGISQDSTMTFANNNEGVKAMFRSASTSNAAYMRSAEASFAFTQEDKDKQAKAGV